MLTTNLDPRVRRTRKRTASAVLKLLVENGPEAVTHQRVAEEAGIGRATIYRHWPTRPNLLFDAFDDFPYSTSVPADLPLRETLIGMLERVCELLDSPMSRAIISLISQADWEPENRAVLDRRVDRVRREIESLFKRAAREEHLVVDVPADTVLWMVAGPLLAERLLTGRIASRDRIPDHIDSLLTLWGASPDSSTT